MATAPDKKITFETEKWRDYLDSSTKAALHAAKQSYHQLQTSCSQAQKWIDVELRTQFRNGVTREHITGGAIAVTAIGSIFLTRNVARKLWTRYWTAADIPVSLVERGLKLPGVCVRVPDGDGIRIFHTPPLRWFFERWRISKTAKKADSSIYVSTTPFWSITSSPVLVE